MTTVDLSWKLRAQKAEHAAESSAALVRKLAKNFELLYSEITTEQLKQQFNAEQFDGLIQAHRAAQSLLSDPAVENILKT